MNSSITPMPGAGAYARIRLHGLGDLLREQARSRPELTALVDGKHRLGFRALDLRVNRLVHVLRGRGAGENSRLLWIGQNSFRLIEALLAAAKLGASLCPINWRISPAEARFILEDFDPSVAFWEDGEVGPLSRALLELGANPQAWIQHDGTGPEGYEALIAAAPDADEDLPVDPDLPLLAIYTAAFDGRPAAAMLSHTSLLLTGLLSQQGQSITEGSSYLASGPMFHLGVLMGALGVFIAGGRNVIVARVVAAELLDLIERERVTHGYIPQPTVEQMRELNKTACHDVSSLFATPDMRDWHMPMVMPAGAPLITSMGGYGQTEIGGLTILTWLGGSGAGRPAPFMQVRIVDAADCECGPEETGEIVVRGPMVMCGYHNREATNTARSAAGWHHTHDLGKRKSDGSIVFVGPKTTMIKSGVENIYPGEVEACLRAHPAVADVCVIGVPDPTWDQNVKAVVVAKPGQRPEPQELIEHCRARIASYKKPKIVTFVEVLPRTAAGAMDRAAVDRDHGGGGYPSVG